MSSAEPVTASAKLANPMAAKQPTASRDEPGSGETAAPTAAHPSQPASQSAPPVNPGNPGDRNGNEHHSQRGQAQVHRLGPTPCSEALCIYRSDGSGKPDENNQTRP